MPYTDIRKFIEQHNRRPQERLECEFCHEDVPRDSYVIFRAATEVGTGRQCVVVLHPHCDKPYQRWSKGLVQ